MLVLTLAAGWRSGDGAEYRSGFHAHRLHGRCFLQTVEKLNRVRPGVPIHQLTHMLQSLRVLPFIVCVRESTPVKQVAGLT